MLNKIKKWFINKIKQEPLVPVFSIAPLHVETFYDKNNHIYDRVYTIPTEGLSPEQAEQEIATLIADYKGTINVAGSKDLPYSKEYWLPNKTRHSLNLKHIINNIPLGK